MKLYKLRDMSTGLYSTGGYYPRWTKSGKVWHTIGTLKTHLKNIVRYSKAPVSPLWEVVELHIVESERYPAVAVTGTNAPKSKAPI